MTIISTEMLKWKRNKTVLGIFILTAILGIFAVERAFSISDGGIEFQIHGAKL